MIKNVNFVRVEDVCTLTTTIMANLQFILVSQRFDTNIYSKFYSDTNKADTWKSVPVSHDKNYETGWPTRALTSQQTKATSGPRSASPCRWRTHAKGSIKPKRSIKWSQKLVRYLFMNSWIPSLLSNGWTCFEIKPKIEI